MKIISADWLVICDENNSIIQNGAVVFTDKIQEVDTLNNIEKKYYNNKYYVWTFKFFDDVSILEHLSPSTSKLETQVNSRSTSFISKWGLSKNVEIWLSSFIELLFDQSGTCVGDLLPSSYLCYTKLIEFCNIG